MAESTSKKAEKVKEPQLASYSAKTKDEVKGRDHASRRRSSEKTLKEWENPDSVAVTSPRKGSIEYHGEGARPKDTKDKARGPIQGSSMDEDRIKRSKPDSGHSMGPAHDSWYNYPGMPGSSSDDMYEYYSDDEIYSHDDGPAPDMCGTDRYKTGSEETAFRQIDISELRQVQEIQKKASKIMLHRMRAQERDLQTDNPDMDQLADLSKQSSDEDDEELAMTPDGAPMEKSWEIMDQLEQEESETTQATDSQLAAAMEEMTVTDAKATCGAKDDVEKADGTGKAGTLSMGALVKVQRWMRASRKGTMKTFAKNSEHYRLLNSTANKFMIDTPLPLKILMYKDLLPILHTTVSEYNKQLGKKHTLTIQAQERVAEMTRWGQAITEL